MKTRYPNVTVNPDQHGKLRARYRKAGVLSAYLSTLPDQPGFEAELKRLLGGIKTAESLIERHHPLSVNAVLARYYQSADFNSGGDADKKRRRLLLESFRNEFGKDYVTDFEFQHIERILLDRSEKRQVGKRIVGGQVAAVNLRKQLRRFFAFAKKLKLIKDNPVEEAGKVGKAKLNGYQTWGEEQIAAFKKRHPIGTKARLALEIFLWTWQRRGDGRLFGPKHIVNGKVAFTAGKNQRTIWLPLAPDLKRAIDAMPAVGLTTYLVTEYGKPFSKAGFGNWFADRCKEAGLEGYRAHGLRKAGARRAAQAEATQQGLKAVGGWANDEEVATYTAAVEQESLAALTLAKAIAKFSDGGGS